MPALSAQDLARSRHVATSHLDGDASGAAEERHHAGGVLVEDEGLDALVLEALLGELGFGQVGKGCNGDEIHTCTIPSSRVFPLLRPPRELAAVIGFRLARPRRRSRTGRTNGERLFCRFPICVLAAAIMRSSLSFFIAASSLFVTSSLVVACSDSSTGSNASSSGGTSSGQGGGGATCPDACAHVESICGAPAPACEKTCASWTSQQRTCVVAASTCAAANTCGSTPDTKDDAGNGGSSGQTPSPGECKDTGDACGSFKDCRSYDCYCASGLSGVGSACSAGTCTDPVESCKTTCSGLMENYVRVEAGVCPK